MGDRMTPDPVDLAARLLACPSVTPADAGAQAVLADALAAIGFTVHRLEEPDAPGGAVHNLFAIRQGGPRHLAFAGHTDVVPAGAGWRSDPFAPALRDGRLFGRGAVDMKGAIAAFIAAAGAVPRQAATLSLVITGDEEGPATHGTVALMRWMAAQAIRPDMILVGEPTSEATLGDMIKIGRRGSVNMVVEIAGTQGHVAYPHLAANPVPPLARIVARLSALELDRGTDWFQPTNLEVTDLHVGNPAHNLIPGRASARLNIRFNDLHRGADLLARVREIATAEHAAAEVHGTVSGEAFLTPPGPLVALVEAAVAAETGRAPVRSTGGGTSDARFLSALAPTVELGLVNATMHKVDECVAVDDLHALARIYEGVIRRAGAAG